MYHITCAGCEEAKESGLNKSGVYQLHDAVPTGKVYTEVNATGTHVYLPLYLLTPNSWILIG